MGWNGGSRSRSRSSENTVEKFDNPKGGMEGDGM